MTNTPHPSLASLRNRQRARRYRLEREEERRLMTARGWRMSVAGVWVPKQTKGKATR